MLIISAGEVDAEAYGGHEALERLKNQVGERCAKIVAWSRDHGMPAKVYTGFSTDAVETLQELCLKAREDHPNVVFVATRRDDAAAWLGLHPAPWRHRALSLQRRLHAHDAPLIVLPMRVEIGPDRYFWPITETKRRPRREFRAAARQEPSPKISAVRPPARRKMPDKQKARLFPAGLFSWVRRRRYDLGDGEPGLGEPGGAVVGLDRLPGLRGVGFLAALELRDAEADLHEVGHARIHLALGEGFLEQVDRLGVVARAEPGFSRGGVGIARRPWWRRRFGLGEVGRLVGLGVGLGALVEALVAVGVLVGRAAERAGLEQRRPDLLGLDRVAAAGGPCRPSRFARSC